MLSAEESNRFVRHLVTEGFLSEEMFENKHHGIVCYIKPGRAKADALMRGQTKVREDEEGQRRAYLVPVYGTMV